MVVGMFFVIQSDLEKRKQRVNFCEEFGFEGIKYIRTGYATGYNSCFKIQDNELILKEINRYKNKDYFVNKE